MRGGRPAKSPRNPRCPIVILARQFRRVASGFLSSRVGAIPCGSPVIGLGEFNPQSAIRNPQFSPSSFVILVSGFVISTSAIAASPVLQRAERDFTLDRADGYSQLIRSLAPAEGAASYRYSPSILTIAAGIESCRYDRGGAATWQREPLPWPGLPADRYYTRDVPAHVRWGSPAQKRVFLIFGSSYSTWARGTWTNKTASILRRRFDEPHLVAFAGFLTPEFLALQARRPAANTQEPARDLYARLRAALEAWKQAGRIPRDAHVGLIGFSGGARLAVSLLAEDQRRSGNSPLFDQGAIAFSPVLDLPASYEVLDGANAALDRRGFPPGSALTDPILPALCNAFLLGYSPFDPAPFLRLTRSDASRAADDRRRETISRFYREFEAVDLPTTTEATYPDAPNVRQAAEKLRDEGRLNYRSYYLGLVLKGKRDARGAETETSLLPEIAAIHKPPLYLVFAKDDPVLSEIDPELSGKQGRFPDSLRTMLHAARRQPNVRVFTPEHGAHLGYLLDSSYLSSALSGFFGSAR